MPDAVPGATPGKASARTILHVDMDAFFAAIEQLDRSELRGQPVIVGAPRDARGVVATCSYEARVYGVHSGMPSRVAARRCPTGIFVPVRGERYREVSRQIFTVFESMTPTVEPLSIDEAFLDVTAALHLYGDGAAAGRELRRRVRAITGLTASVGVAGNKFLAKLASDLEKPDGLTVVPREPSAVRRFLAPLEVRRVWGVGPKAGAALARVGVHTIGDLQRVPLGRLTEILGPAHAQQLQRLARGIDAREVAVRRADKSISHEHTFQEDCRQWTSVEREVLALAERVGARLRQQPLGAATVFVKLRWADFETLTRQRRLAATTRSDRVLIRESLALLRGLRCARAVRLVGVGVGLAAETAPAAEQLLLFDAPETGESVTGSRRDEALDSAVDALRSRYGAGSLRRGL